MAKQTIEELISKIKENAGYLWYNPGAEAKDFENDVFLGSSYEHNHFSCLTDEYIRGIYNEELIVKSGIIPNAEGYIPGRHKSPWIMYGRLLLPSRETEKKIVNERKDVPIDGILGKLGFTKTVDSYEKDVPVDRVKSWPSDKTLGTGYIHFGLWTAGCNRDGRGLAEGGNVLIVLQTDIQETSNYSNNDLLTPIIEFLKENPFNATLLLKGIFDEKRFPKSHKWMDAANIVEEYYGKIRIIKEDKYTNKKE